MAAEWLTSLVQSIKVPSDIAKSALGPSAENIGKGLGNIFYLVFSPLEKAHIRKEAEIRKFKEEVEHELSLIAPEKIKEPPLNIVGPAIEAAKYYIEHEEIRGLFAKLLASAMDKDKEKFVHPSFVEIIKQLSPLDAHLVKTLYNRSNMGSGHLILDIYSNNSAVIVYKYIFPIESMDSTNIREYSTSMDNLIRLGLISVDQDRSFAKKERYEVFDDYPLIAELKDKIVEDHKSLGSIGARFVHTSWLFTDLGQNFCSTCLSSLSEEQIEIS
ncbi:DUF4393 domain-containing protein [Paenibacillus sp. ACRRY]|uniref:DUF4393 domain-containing protein n=1 Tax=Paenibacillus sp. ACRRY TaxID=2918208 RepID=UPI001EF6B249|nr:DUF4393 domain-containing protein [Paenibacillus sp. ACRRY]MCG7386851.1 DUF4393 domain-containing protein [Paenibacillus sp. ACRRY]